MLNISKLATILLLFFSANSCFSDEVILPDTTPRIPQTPGYPPGVWLISPYRAHGLPNVGTDGFYSAQCEAMQITHCGDSPTCKVFPPSRNDGDGRMSAGCPLDTYRDGREGSAGFSWSINYSCQKNYSWDETLKACVRAPELSKDSGSPPCGNKKGNPVNAAGGNKFQEEVLYEGAGNFPLRFSMFYNSAQFRANSTGFTEYPLWRDSYEATLEEYMVQVAVGFFQKKLLMIRPDGTRIVFEEKNGMWVANGNINGKLTHENSKENVWKYVNDKGDVETYSGGWYSVALDAGSKELNPWKHTYHYLTSIETKNHYRINIERSSEGRLASVSDSFGKQLTFQSKNDGRGIIYLMKDPAGGVTEIMFDMPSRLTSVLFPDGKKRRYIYQDQERSFGVPLLTGIEDENSARFATWTYELYGDVWNGGLYARASSSRHGRDADVFSFSYLDDGSTLVTDPLKSSSQLNFQRYSGRNYITTQSQPAGSGCAASTSTLAYDFNANIVSKLNFNGTKTLYAYESRNLEVERTEASGTPQAKTTSTSWHSTYRVPVQINEPLLRTTFVYDDSGNLLSKTEQATSYANGSKGAAAEVVGLPRVWNYTYNSFGQMLTETGPRTDVVDKVTYTYDEKGNLTSITNAAGHVTSYSNYDPHGHVGTITDPNGLVTTLTYAPRGWLTSRTTTGDGVLETSSYTYDGVGQMTQVTLPDGNSVNYSYDDAHRLIKITDNIGNSINYTLDGMGNRVNETVTDVSGNLKRRITRIYDALNRLQQVTGGVQ
jgi:YD repeat-containing protein